MIKVEGNQVHVDTCTLKATFEAGVLVFLMRKVDGRTFIQSEVEDICLFDLSTRGKGRYLWVENREIRLYVCLSATITRKYALAPGMVMEYLASLRIKRPEI